MKAYGILFLLFFLLPVLGTAQTDTTYIAPLEHKLGIRAYTGRKLLALSYDDDNGTERSYMPNSPVDFGFGISVYNTVIGLDLGYGFRLQDEEKYGKTKSFDFQLHHYNRRFVVDLYIQQYKGFGKRDQGLSRHAGRPLLHPRTLCTQPPAILL